MPLKKEPPPPGRDANLPIEYQGELRKPDVSTHPSYTKLVVPYYVICRQRYLHYGMLYNRQLIQELLLQESLQSKAMDGIREHREFARGVLIRNKARKMFKNTYQSGFLSIMYSVGAHPLSIWDKTVKNGHIRRITDEDVRSLVIELMGTNVATTYISAPGNPRQTLGIKLPFLVMIVKNMKKYFTFEIQILDDKEMHRRFRVSNFQSTTRVRPFCTTMPIGLSPGWNQIQFNLSDFTKRAYGTNYLETTRVQIHANVRIRRIYFSDRLYTEDEMPQEFKLYLPLSASRMRRKSEYKPSKPFKDAGGNLPPPIESGIEASASVPAPPATAEPEVVAEPEAETPAPVNSIPSAVAESIPSSAAPSDIGDEPPSTTESEAPTEEAPE